jgi:cytoskeletal protein CcmA (bactofilin family)
MALKILAEQVHHANVDLNHNQLNNARIQNLSAEPTSNNAAGRIFYDTDTNQIKVYNGSAFVQLVTETTDSNDITDVESILNTSLVVGRDAHNQIKFSTDDQIIFRVGNADGVTFKASGEIEATSLDISGDVDIDGTLETDALSIASTTVSSTAAELNLVDGSSAGTIVNSKAVIYGSSGEVNATTLQIGGTSITATAAELNVNDGVTAGTVAASKVVVVDSNKDIASFRNVTLTGELDAATLDISGDADIDGTLEADAITIGGTNLLSEGMEFTGNTVFSGNPSFSGTPSVSGTLSVAGNIVHTGDTNCLIGFTTDAIKFQTGGTSRANVSDSGFQIGSGARVTTIEDNDSLGTSDTKLATQGNVKAYVDARTGTNITSLGTIAQDTVTFTSANANDPNVVIKNTTNDANGARLTFTKDKGAAGADNDEIGEIRFVGDDGAQTLTEFGAIRILIAEADDTDEAGVMKLSVASSDGTDTGLTDGLTITGHKSGDYVDATIGAGTSSTVTVEGSLQVDGDLTVSGTNTILDSTTIATGDSFIKLAKDQGTSSDAVDFGFYGKYGESGTAKYAGLFRDAGATDEPFTFFQGTQLEPGTTLNPSGTGYALAPVKASKVIASSLDISGDADIDGTMEADAYTVNGTALDEFISDTVGAMVGSNTETGISVTYQDGDNTIDFALSAAQTTITSLLATDIKIGEDDQTKIDFETADEIHFYAANVEQVYLADNIFGPQSDSDVDLGSSSVRWKDAYVDSITVTGEIDGASLDISGNADIDGTLEADAITINGSAILAQATTSAVGCVELATTAEALAGSDSSRAVTPEGLAARSYSESIGDGSATAIAVDHNLNTRDVIVQLYDVSSYDTVIADVVRTTVDRVTITFASAPSSNDIRVLVTKID